MGLDQSLFWSIVIFFYYLIFIFQQPEAGAMDLEWVVAPSIWISFKAALFLFDKLLSHQRKVRLTLEVYIAPSHLLPVVVPSLTLR